MYRYDPFDGLRDALRMREADGIFVIPDEMTDTRFKDFAGTKLRVLLRRLGHVLRQGGIPSDIRIELPGPDPYVAAVFGHASHQGIFFRPGDAHSMNLTVRFASQPVQEEQHRLRYRDCTSRFIERVIEQAVQRVVLQPPI
mgnify:CR=1 FL=1|jgi:hypothetical protein